MISLVQKLGYTLDVLLPCVFLAGRFALEVVIID